MLNIVYRFLIPDGPASEYDVVMDESGAVAMPDDQEPADWTRLEFHQCPNCPLRVEEVPHCPVALHLSPLIKIADRLQSFDRVSVEVRMGDRMTSGETTAQRAMSSLLGLVMATSGCPRAAYLRPMARFHLPLSGEEETVYRAASMYLLAQYFRHREGHKADWDLSGLADLYRELQTVNIALAERVRAASEKDTAANAIVLLDLLAKGLPYTIEDSLQELHEIFSIYLAPNGKVRGP